MDRPGAVIIPALAAACVYGVATPVCDMLSRPECCSSGIPEVARSKSSGRGLFLLCSGEPGAWRCGGVISGYKGDISELGPPNGLLAILSVLEDPMPGLMRICEETFGDCCCGITGWL